MVATGLDMLDLTGLPIIWDDPLAAELNAPDEDFCMLDPSSLFAPISPMALMLGLKEPTVLVALTGGLVPKPDA